MRRGCYLMIQLIMNRQLWFFSFFLAFGCVWLLPTLDTLSVFGLSLTGIGCIGFGVLERKDQYLMLTC